MSCEMEQELTAYVDGELGEALRQKVASHLTGCASCRTTEALLRHTVETLRFAPSVQPSPELRRNVMRRIDALSPWRRGFWSQLLRPAVLVPVGALAAGLIAVLGLTHRPEVDALDLQDPGQLEIAQNFEVIDDLDVVGLESVDDIDVIGHLHELEAAP